MEDGYLKPDVHKKSIRSHTPPFLRIPKIPQPTSAQLPPSSATVMSTSRTKYGQYRETHKISSFIQSLPSIKSPKRVKFQSPLDTAPSCTMKVTSRPKTPNDDSKTRPFLTIAIPYSHSQRSPLSATNIPEQSVVGTLADATRDEPLIRPPPPAKHWKPSPCSRAQSRQQTPLSAAMYQNPLHISTHQSLRPPPPPSLLSRRSSINNNTRTRVSNGSPTISYRSPPTVGGSRWKVYSSLPLRRPVPPPLMPFKVLDNRSNPSLYGQAQQKNGTGPLDLFRYNVSSLIMSPLSTTTEIPNIAELPAFEVPEPPATDHSATIFDIHGLLDTSSVVSSPRLPIKRTPSCGRSLTGSSMRESLIIPLINLRYPLPSSSQT